MKENLSQEEYDKIKELVNCAVNAANKKDAENYIKKIHFEGYGLVGRANNIFNELVCYVKDASGRVTDKERRIYAVNSKLYELEIYGVK